MAERPNGPIAHDATSVPPYLPEVLGLVSPPRAAQSLVQATVRATLAINSGRNAAQESIEISKTPLDQGFRKHPSTGKGPVNSGGKNPRYNGTNSGLSAFLHVVRYCQTWYETQCDGNETVGTMLYNEYLYGNMLRA